MFAALSVGSYIINPEIVSRITCKKLKSSLSKTIHASLALASLDEIELFVEHNKTIYLRYMANMKGVKALKIKEFEIKAII